MNAISTSTAAPTLIAAFCLLATVAGCQSRNNNANEQEMSSGPSNSLEQRVSATRSTLGQGLTTVTLNDTSMNDMPATEVSVPRGWHVQGNMGTVPCSSLPSPTWDASSPNGKSQMNVLPSFGWKWGMGAQNRNGCIPLSGPLHAADFLQKFTARLHGIRVVGTMPVTGAFVQREVNFTNNFNNNNARLPVPLQARHMGDVAAIEAVDSTGHELRLRAWVQCQERQGRLQGGNCFARVDVLRAPKGQLEALAALVDGHNLVQDHPTQEWMGAYMNRQQQIANGQMQQLRRNEDAGNAALAQNAQNAKASSQMLHNQYLSSSQTLRDEHEAGMQQLQSSTDSSMRNAQASQNARSTSASDMEDYSLNQQTVSGANGTYKTSSQYSNVWSSPVGPANSDGRTYGSTDNTTDPNTATDNTWTKDTKVHGNGQSY
ncbi:MAG: hypothetical protein WA700_10725 [Acidobacteriaceae bacterium]